MHNSSTKSGTYLYGIVRGLPAGPPPLPAVGDLGAEVRAIGSAGCVAVVSDVADVFVEATAEDLQRHSDVLQELLNGTEALVPLRFGTVYPDDATLVSDLLEARGEELQALLDRVENCVEARLKAFYVEEAILGEIVAEHPRIAELHRRTRSLSADAAYYDRIRLGELIAEALSEKRRRDGAQVLSRLVPLTADHCVEEEAHEWSLLTASFLVERSKVDAFHSAVGGLAEDSEHRMQLRCLAPLPPYSFVALPATIEAEAAWA